MAYQSWSVVFGEQPSAAKWNILGTNDASFNDGTGIADGAVLPAKVADGFVVQVQSTNYAGVATGTTIIPGDDTVPQNTEGTEFMTQAITPKSATNILVIDVVFFGSVSAGDDIIVALFQDTTADAIAATNVLNATANGRMILTLRHRMVAGTTSATTFKVRAGGDASSTISFNGVGGTVRFGAATKSNITITEYKAS